MDVSFKFTLEICRSREYRCLFLFSDPYRTKPPDVCGPISLPPFSPILLLLLLPLLLLFFVFLLRDLLGFHPPSALSAHARSLIPPLGMSCLSLGG